MTNLNLIVATHGKFGEELVASAEMILGKVERVFNLSLLPEESFEDFYEQTQALFSTIEGPTIALVDLFGGTPCNVLTALTKQFDHKVISGVNLPMFIELYMKGLATEVLDLDQIIKESFPVFTGSIVLTNEQLEA